MKNTLYFLFLVLLIASCSASRGAGANSTYVKQELIDPHTFKIVAYSDDRKYGYTEKDPIKVGGAKGSEGPLNERRFLNALAGPNGEEISYSRNGSCCHFKTKHSPFSDTGLLDVYSITYDGLKEPITLYINMYDSDTLKVPVGFSLKN